MLNSADKLRESDIIAKGLLEYQKGTLFRRERREYDYSTRTYKGKEEKLRKMNTLMSNRAKAMG